jgi:Ca2+-transporting ATPase
MGLLEPTNLLLLACTLIYAAIGEPGQATILLVLVAGISLLALAELARLAAPLVQLQRNGIELKVAPEQVQRGDQLRLEEGDRLAADARLTKAVGPC